LQEREAYQCARRGGGRASGNWAGNTEKVHAQKGKRKEKDKSSPSGGKKRGGRLFRRKKDSGRVREKGRLDRGLAKKERRAAIREGDASSRKKK